tara:strand:+ start:223 stop:1854 length:1632 start_codon:yes stop_codon:yes gene_type:complete
MTLDGFITLLTLLVAGYALVPVVRRMQLRLAARGALLLQLFIVLFGVLYFEFWELTSRPCPSAFGEFCPWLELRADGPVKPQQAAFLVALAGLILIAWSLTHWQIRDRDIPSLKRLVDRLLEERRYSEVIDMLQPSLQLLDESAGRKRPYQLRRDRWAPTSDPHLLQLAFLETDDDHEAESPCWLRRASSKCKSWVGRCLPTGDKEQEAAADLLRTLFRRSELIEHICRDRPRFAAHLLGLQTFGVDDFADDLLTWMVGHPESVLYQEIALTQNLKGISYELEPSNYTLFALLSDVEVAQRLEAYRPVGEAGLARINEAIDPRYCSSLNLPHDNHWQERGRLKDPTYVSVRFFDIMVRSAVSQNVNWHMWLYYMPHFVDALEEIYDDSSAQVDREAEWPTRAASLLYEIIDCLREWVRLASRVDDQSIHRLPENDRVEHENGNIPKSAAIALGMSVRTIVVSERISDRFKEYILAISLRTVNDLPRNGAMAELRAVTLRSIAQGGLIDRGDEYQQMLRDLYESIHEPWHNDVDDFEELIGFGS